MRGFHTTKVFTSLISFKQTNRQTQKATVTLLVMLHWQQGWKFYLLCTCFANSPFQNHNSSPSVTLLSLMWQTLHDDLLWWMHNLESTRRSNGSVTTPLPAFRSADTSLPCPTLPAVKRHDGLSSQSPFIVVKAVFDTLFWRQILFWWQTVWVTDTVLVTDRHRLDDRLTPFWWQTNTVLVTDTILVTDTVLVTDRHCFGNRQTPFWWRTPF